MAPTAGTLTVNDIISIVIGLLAAESHMPPDQLRAELEAVDREMSINSLRVVEVLAKVETACGVRLPVTRALAMSTRSVLSFARAVRRELDAKGEPGDGE